MAYIQRRGKHVDVYYYDAKTRKNVKIPREQTKHLAGLDEASINIWISEWESRNGRINDKISRRVNFSDSKLTALFDLYLEDRVNGDGLHPDRAKEEKRWLENYLLPFFIRKHGCKDLKKWGEIGWGLRAWLIQQKPKGRIRLNSTLSVKTAKAIIQSANRFGRWLKGAGHIDVVWAFPSPKLGRKRSERVTPLPRSITPLEVLDAAKKLIIQNPEWAIAVLVGYFAALRPSETFALTKKDFLTGDFAAENSLTYSRLKLKDIGTKLAVEVTKALEKNKILGPPKNYHSNGVVTVWNVDAAKMLAAILRELPDGRIFRFGKVHLFRKYHEIVFPLLSVTLHDLRRAAGLYLGRGHYGLDPYLLQDFLRHGDLESTQLYTRRPRVDITTTGHQDLDDVI